MGGPSVRPLSLLLPLPASLSLCLWKSAGQIGRATRWIVRYYVRPPVVLARQLEQARGQLG